MSPGVLLSSAFISELQGQLIDSGDFTHLREGPPTKFDHFVRSGGLGKAAASCCVVHDTDLNPHRP
eukprot:5326153-Pyramimonas_sp.AAC.1